MKGRGMNFEEIEKEGNTMNQGEFYKFCTDFNIPLTKVVNYFFSTIFLGSHRFLQEEGSQTKSTFSL